MSILEADLSGKLTRSRTAVASRIRYIDSQLFTVMILSPLNGLSGTSDMERNPPGWSFTPCEIGIDSRRKLRDKAITFSNFRQG